MWQVLELVHQSMFMITGQPEFKFRKYQTQVFLACISLDRDKIHNDLFLQQGISHKFGLCA